MKYLFLLLLLPSVCFGVTLSNVTLSGRVAVGIIPNIMFVGASNAQGTGDIYTNETGTWENVAGFRDNMITKLGLGWRVVGDWGRVSPNGVGKVDNSTHMIGYDQPRHFAYPGWETEPVMDEFVDLTQLAKWFPKPNDSHSTIIIDLGTNDIQDIPFSCGVPDNATCSTRLIAKAVTDGIALIDIIQEYDPEINVITNLMVPNSYADIQVFVEPFNSLFQEALDNETKTNSNLFVADPYTLLFDCWDFTEPPHVTDPGSCNNDGVHANPLGFEMWATLLYNIMKTEGLTP